VVTAWKRVRRRSSVRLEVARCLIDPDLMPGTDSLLTSSFDKATIINRGLNSAARVSVVCISAFLVTAGCDGPLGKLDANVTAERCPDASSGRAGAIGKRGSQIEQTCTLYKGDFDAFDFDAFLVVEQRETVHGAEDPALNVTSTYQELTQISCKVVACSVVLFRVGKHPGNIGINDVLSMRGYHATINGSRVVVERSAFDRYTFDLGSRQVVFTLLDPYLDRHGRGTCAGSAPFPVPTK
jgi:hypothetical protein